MRRLLVVSLLSLLVFLPASLTAQLRVEVKEQFAKVHPTVRYYEQDGVPSMIYGKAFSTGSTPLESAWNHVNDWKNLYAKDSGTLIAELKDNGTPLQGVMYNRETGKYKFYALRFNQTIDGVPVFRSGVGFLVRNEENNPLVMTGFDVKEMKGFRLGRKAKTKPTVTNQMLDNVWNMMEAHEDHDHDHGHGEHGEHDEEEEEAAQQAMMAKTVSVLEKPASSKKNILTKARNTVNRAIQDVVQFVTAPGIETSEEKLVVWAGGQHETVNPRLAVSFIAKRGSIQTLPEYQKFLIVADAVTGEILLSETQIVGVDVVGTVKGRATDGVATLECDPESVFDLPYGEVSIAGGNTVFANEHGVFEIPHGGSSAVSVTSRLRGTYFEVFDQAAGGAIPSLTMITTPPGPANFIHNQAAGNDLSTANVNTYLEANLCRDFVLHFEPTFPVINSETFFDINTNINSSCNAFYDGSSINFYQAGGGCNNTAMADVIYHEYGHHLVNVTNNGQGQFGEGAGDSVAVLIQDEPILAHGFTGNCSQGIRNANNNHQYPCNGAIHDCGNLISGCVWDTRNELAVTEPNDYQDIGSALFLGMMIVRGNLQPGNTTIDPSITIMYLELDDDDNDIGNGTPHYSEIAAGFGAHNMDAPPLNLLGFEYPNGRPELISPSGGVAFTVQVVDLVETHASGTGQLHVDRGNGYETFSMNEIGPGLYEAEFPESDCATLLTYYFSAGTTNNNTQTDPSDAPDGHFTALSADSVEVLFEDDFNTNKGWSVSGNASDGQWTRGNPIGGGDRGDPPTDFDGSGACYLTDNVDGNSDVDGGTTILTSPIFDGTVGAGNIAFLKYSRWYNNVAGNAPEADIFTVEISNNGGSSWVNLETVGPTGSQVQGGWFEKGFKISDFVTPTNQMRVRFSASDLGDGSIVEAGVDAFEVLEIHCTQTIAPDTITMVTGEIESGDETDLADSDDSRVTFVTEGGVGRFISIEFKAFSQTETPSLMKINLETKLRKNVNQIQQTLSLYNFDTDEFEKIDIRNMTFAETAATLTITGDLSRFVEPGTKCIKASVSCAMPVQNGLNGQFRAEFDEMTWEIGN